MLKIQHTVTYNYGKIRMKKRKLLKLLKKGRYKNEICFL